MLVIIMLFSTISCDSNNEINDEFVIIEFNVNNNLLSDKSALIENIFQITFPTDYNKIENANFQKVKSIIDFDTTAYFQLSLVTIYNSLSGCSAILSKILSENNVFNEIDSSYNNLLLDNFKTKNINKSKIKINGINSIQFIITTIDKVIIKLIFKIKGFYYQLDYIIPFSIYQEKLKSIESSIGSLNKQKEIN